MLGISLLPLLDTLGPLFNSIVILITSLLYYLTYFRTCFLLCLSFLRYSITPVMISVKQSKNFVTLHVFRFSSLALSNMSCAMCLFNCSRLKSYIGVHTGVFPNASRYSFFVGFVYWIILFFFPVLFFSFLHIYTRQNQTFYSVYENKFYEKRLKKDNTKKQKSRCIESYPHSAPL